MSTGELHIDFETRSLVNLKVSGLAVYAEHWSTDLWCACFALDDGPVQVWRPGQPPPILVAAHVHAGGAFVAHNANFERTIWHHVLAPHYDWPEPKLEQWHCTAAMAAAMALPRDLDRAAIVMGLPHKKDSEGHGLMLRMCRPRSGPVPDCPHCGGNGRLGLSACVCIKWWDEPDKVDRLIAYCQQDVRVERALKPKLRPLSPTERRLWLLDAQINDRGIKVDLPTVKHARKLVDAELKRLSRQVTVLTDGVVTAPSQVARLTSWLDLQGLPVDSLDKASVKGLLADELAPALRRTIEIRAEASKSSTAKLKAFAARASSDARLRHMLLFCGASTGRWSGSGAQPHNMPRPSETTNVELALRALIDGWPGDTITALFGESLLQIVSDCLRGLLTADDGKELIAADFSNIEGRVNAWLAGEEWKLQAFRDFDAGTGPDLYLVAAARMYGVPVETYTKKSPERQHGKVSELALGYQGGVAAFQKMAANYGVEIEDERAEEIKVAWREANPAIVESWWELDDAAKRAVRNPGQVVRACGGRIAFGVKGSFLWMRLPNGRLLAYARPKLEESEREVTHPDGSVEKIKRWGVTFWGINSVTKQWSKTHGYGGLWCENAVQAIARDIMAEGMLNVEAAGYPVVLTVHDEIVSEVPEGFGGLEEYEQLMSRLPAWAEGCPVVAAGWRGKRYRKG